MEDFAELYINKGVLFGLTVSEDNGDVVLSIAACRAFAVDTFDEHTLRFALHDFKILDFVLQRDLSHDLAAFGFQLFGYLVGHDCGLGASAL